MKIILPVYLTLAFASLVHSQTLREQLEAREAAGSKKVTPEVKEEFAKGIASIKVAQIVEGAKKVGDQAPDFTLKNAAGKSIRLASELKRGTVVLTWYRGGWCPYCNIAMAAMQKELPAIKKTGATLIAITPELPDKTLTTKEKNGLDFEVLTDLNHQAARQYGLLFKLTPGVEKLYGKFFDLKKYNGEDAGTDTLPLAATYIIGQDGKILWAFLHHDYHMRAEPKEIVQFLNNLNEESSKNGEQGGADKPATAPGR
ncbi:peroxiredoxin-like family protein [Prosthecobacter sp.]|uniref:peroxiredoxin-like family protein n=1 Tax=Prosthecobacter sp. TaxID=1965333 RepID=UPI0024882714|nr:peroxiredoxin-like family protein [Prosthecobacter sp.]MDI1312218.1 peroxiredoxin-like family protein [Prosthecobacter sp.]